MQQTDHQLEVQNLTFTRSDQELFCDLNFTVTAGTLLQIIGPNGIGKTTLLRIIAGLIAPEHGAIYWCGSDIRKCTSHYNDQLAYLGHQPGVSMNLTPRENLQLTAALHTTKDHSLDELLNQFNLLALANIPTVQLSAGQQRRVALACLLMRQATLWILDEPLAALDHNGTTLIEQLLYNHVQQGGIVLITTHQSLPLSHLSVQRLELGHV